MFIGKKGCLNGEKKMFFGMEASREACEWSGVPAEGMLRNPTCPPSRAIFVLKRSFCALAVSISGVPCATY